MMASSDIQIAVLLLIKWMYAPDENAWRKLKKAIKYLKGKCTWN